VNANAAVSSTLNRSNPFPALPDLGGTNWALDVINAPEVWNQNITGNGIVVAVVDSGVDYTHPDLDGNIWRNAGEIAGNGIDDDRNGYIDDIRGWDFVASDNNPMDLDFDGHGTHIAGAIAAERNNFGITGVAPNAKIMPVRVLPPSVAASRIMLLLESAMLLIMEPM
jgi:subtilisin family serine protease